MAYEKQEWTYEDWLKGRYNVQEKLNHMEDGIANAGEGNSLPEGGDNGDVLTKHVEVTDREATFLDDFSVDVGDTLYVDVEALRHLNLKDCFRELGVIPDTEYTAYYYIVFNCVTHDGDTVPVRACIYDSSIVGSGNIMSLGFGQYDGPDPYAEIM